MIEALPLVTLSALLLGAVWTDQKAHRIPNLLILAMLISGLLIRGFMEGTAGLSNGLLGLLAGFLTLIFPYMRGGMAAGDVKLLAAVGVFVGPVIVVIAGLLATLVGALMGGVLIALQRRVHDSVSIEQMLTQRFPFAAAIALGTAAALIIRGLL